jgi:hypothetical protein
MTIFKKLMSFFKRKQKWIAKDDGYERGFHCYCIYDGTHDKKEKKNLFYKITLFLINIHCHKYIDRYTRSYFYEKIIYSYCIRCGKRKIDVLYRGPRLAYDKTYYNTKKQKGVRCVDFSWLRGSSEPPKNLMSQKPKSPFPTKQD